MQVELLYLFKYLSKCPQHFVITPLVRLKDRVDYEESSSGIGQIGKNISIAPVYLKSANSRFTNLLNPNILLSDFLSIFKVMSRSKPDVVVCFYVLHAYPLLLLKKIFGFSLCIVAMGSDVHLENNLAQRLVKKSIYRNCELIFARSWKLKERIERESDSRVVVIPSAADVSFFRPLNSRADLRRKWGVKPKSRVILTVCRLDKNKGVDVLIKSLRILNSNDVNLLVVGEGVERKALAELSSTLGIRKSVTFLGFRKREELLELYNLADLFALASYSEGLPRVLVEAMACGCIPIVTNVGDATAVVIDGLNGFIVDAGDHEKLANRIKEALSLSEEKMVLMRNQAREVVANDFDNIKLIKRMIDDIEGIYLSRNQSR
jgi:glycosyltransferase involved in cell wall biosynthesis